MAEEQKELDEMIKMLKQQRDEMAVKVRLAEVEARDEWRNLTAKMDEVLREYEPAKAAVEETADNVWTALTLAASELKDGFERVRRSL